MKFCWLSSSIVLLLSSLTLCGVIADLSANTPENDDGSSAASAESEAAIPPQGRPAIGTKYAPVDGQDGKPHMGAFVEVPSSSSSENIDGVGREESLPGGSEGVSGADAEPTSLKRLTEEMDSTEQIPESVDGVMNEKNRMGPKEGTRGTEGGVSEKSRMQSENVESGEAKVPYAPKEAIDTPNSGEDGKDGTVQGDGTENDAGSQVNGIGGLEKLTDLPDKPHDIPMPDRPAMQEPESAPEGQDPHQLPSLTPVKEPDDGIIQPFHSFVLSVAMILFSEVGDKTFLVAALMAMRHDRLLVFSAAFTALIAMTVLSAILGHAVPTLISKRVTNFLASMLFLVFGLRLLREGYGMSPDEGVGEEMKEVEMELEEKELLARREERRQSSISPYTLEAGRGRPSRSKQRFPVPPRSPSSSPSPSRSPSPGRSTIKNIFVGLNNLCSLLLSPAWVQTFVMTFLGEWGDRSQIATIAMAAGQDYWWVTGGAITGHAVCTAAAVLGGRAVAGKVSMRVVTLGGAIAFIAFGIIYLIEAAYTD